MDPVLPPWCLEALLKAILCYEKAFKGNPVLRGRF